MSPAMAFSAFAGGKAPDAEVKAWTDEGWTDAEGPSVRGPEVAESVDIPGKSGIIDVDTEAIYDAKGEPELRATRRPAFDGMRNEGFEVGGKRYWMNEHAYNSLFKSGRRDVMPADIMDALKSQPIPAKNNSVEYINPVTGTSVYVNPETNRIVGVWPKDFMR